MKKKNFFFFLCEFKKIHFNEIEIKKLENKYYGDFLTYATQIKFALSCPYIYISKNGELSTYSSEEILNRLPHVNGARDFTVLTKHLKN